MARKSKEEAQETHNRILTAAIDLIAQRGYARTTFEDIAEVLGLTKGAVYWHFKTKPDLLFALIMQASALRVAAIGEPSEVPCGGMRDYFVRWLKHIVENPIAQKLFYIFEFQVELSSELIAELQARLRDVACGPHEIIFRALVELESSGRATLLMPPEQLATAFSGAWFGITKGWFFRKKSFDLPSAVGQVFEAMERSFIQYRE